MSGKRHVRITNMNYGDMLMRQIRYTDIDATISPDGLYRYRLHRRWEGCGEVMLWIMLNPSTADHREDDATIRRCVRFADDWGYSGIDVYNLYALRTTYPDELFKHVDPVGPLNDVLLLSSCDWYDLVVLGWGADRRAISRGLVVSSFLKQAHCLGYTLNGQPKHPLYVRADTPLVPYVPGGV